MGPAKAAAVLLLPLGFVILLLAGALWFLHRGRYRGARAALVLATALLAVGGLPVVADLLTGSLAAPFPPIAVEQAATSQAIVVLGGGVALAGDRGTAVLGPEANRAWFAARLYQAGKAPLVVVSAGGEPPEAVFVGQLLGQWSVPPEARLLESRSRNTRENALATRDLLAAPAIDRILLVTSAPHMPRAAAAFRAVGFDVTPFPVGTLAAADRALEPLGGWAPTAEALAETAAALLEAAAGLYYRVRGWN